MRFKAAVLHQVGQPLVIEEVECPELRPFDVLVKVQASGLCHTDLEVIQGSLAYPLPIVLGHEGAGVVVEVGSAVTRVKPGDHVVCSWNPHCGHCFYCIRYRRAGGEPVHHFSVMSSHAEYCVVPESGAIVVPREMPFDRACLIGCGVMTGIGAVSRLAKVQAGSSVAVIGCGAVGLNALQGATMAQAEVVIAVDRDPGKLELARRFGATHVLGPDCADLPASVRELTDGRGADYVFECAGGESALQAMYDLMRPGGEGVILGKVNVDQKVSLRFGSMMGEKRVIRSSYGGARPSRDFPWLARRYLEGKLELDALVTMRLPLDRINEGFADMARGEVVRAVLLL